MRIPKNDGPVKRPSVMQRRQIRRSERLQAATNRLQIDIKKAQRQKWIRAKIITFLLPNRFDSTPEGNPAIMPVMVEAAAISPITDALAPSSFANRGSTGLFDIVDEKMAKKPTAHRRRNGLMGKGELFFNEFIF